MKKLFLYVKDQFAAILAFFNKIILRKGRREDQPPDDRYPLF